MELSTSEQRRCADAELAARLPGQTERYAWHLAEATEEPDERVAALLQEVAHANLWPPLQDAVGRLTPRPSELLAILSKTFSDPARLSPAMLARTDASVAGLGQQVFFKLGITSRAALRDALADTPPE